MSLDITPIRIVVDGTDHTTPIRIAVDHTTVTSVVISDDVTIRWKQYGTPVTGFASELIGMGFTHWYDAEDLA